MCGKTLKQAIIAICLSLELSFCCIQVSADGSITNQAEPKQTIMISIADWDELKTEWTGQKLDLAQLRQKFTMLNLNSEEQLKQLEVLQIKLERTEKSLMNATTSLTEVKKRTARIEVIIRRVEERNKENGAQTSGHT
jgi:chromosome segregation ATPase|nr:MAG TPA: hypothetical protein [Caudoviricetes sp.]